jgi:hypothetical protein
MSPCTANGAGRINASAARRPATSPSDLDELMRSAVTVFFRFEGVTLSVSVDCALEKEGDPRSSDARDSDGENGPAGTALSSTEKMERSSPFHWSPQ